MIKGIRKVLGAFILTTMLLVPIFFCTMKVVKASDEDSNIVISEKDNTIKCLFSEESLFFEKYTVDYVILQDTDVLNYSQNHKKSHFFRTQYGIEFSPIADGTARVLMTLHTADGMLEEALLYDISIDDENVSSEMLEHFVPAYAARKGVAKNVRKLMLEDYGFSEDELASIF